MRKLICAVSATLLIAGSCAKFDSTDIWDNINSLDERLTKLEKLCKEMNTNIDALHTLVSALEKNDYITNVTPINQNGEVVGYTMNFVYGDPITIYHGKDGAPGKDGEDGNDSTTPVIGVKQDVDGVYYWTLNGEWLLDENGQKVKAAGTDGKDGQDGATGQPGSTGQPETPGQNGQDGVTPQLKI